MFEMMKPALIAMLLKAAETMQNRSNFLHNIADNLSNCPEEANRVLIRSGIWQDVATMIRESITP